jgi:hypothetical protein
MKSPGVLQFLGRAGKTYEILSANRLGDTFALRDRLSPPRTATIIWSDPQASSQMRFYGVRELK